MAALDELSFLPSVVEALQQQSIRKLPPRSGMSRREVSYLETCFIKMQLLCTGIGKKLYFAPPVRVCGKEMATWREQMALYFHALIEFFSRWARSNL
jgi:hypothetical protein